MPSILGGVATPFKQAGSIEIASESPCRCRLERADLKREIGGSAVQCAEPGGKAQADRQSDLGGHPAIARAERAGQ